MDLDSEIVVEKPSGSDSILHASHTKSTDTAAVILSNAEYRKLIWKLDLHLLPPLFILWFISLIDRVNIGAARIQGLEKDLRMNPLSNQFNIATGMRFDKYSNEGLVNFFFSCCLHRSHDRRGNQTKSVIGYGILPSSRFRATGWLKDTHRLLSSVANVSFLVCNTNRSNWQDAYVE